MKYCYKCGSEVFDEAVVCPKCGVSLANKPVTPKDTEKSKKLVQSIAMIVIGVTIAIISLVCLLSTL